MKYLIAIATLFLAVYASPLRQPWVELQPAIYEKNVGDIWTNCGQTGDEAKIVSVKITPDPPKKGQNVDVEAVVTFEEEVTGGKIDIHAKYGIIPVYSSSLDLCQTMKDANLNITCPIAKGDVTIKVSENIPSIIPSGHYTGDAKVTDQNGKEVACVDFDLHLS